MKFLTTICYLDNQGNRKCDFLVADNYVQDVISVISDYTAEHKYRIDGIYYEEIEVEEEWDPSAYESNNSSSNSNEETEL